jgi:hypothetical protein
MLLKANHADILVFQLILVQIAILIDKQHTIRKNVSNQAFSSKMQTIIKSVS